MNKRTSTTIFSFGLILLAPGISVCMLASDTPASQSSFTTQNFLKKTEDRRSLAWKKRKELLLTTGMLAITALFLKKMHENIPFTTMKLRLRKQFKNLDEKIFNDAFKSWEYSLTYTEDGQTYKNDESLSVPIKTSFIDTERCSLQSDFFKHLKKTISDMLFLENINKKKLTSYTQGTSEEQWFFESSFESDVIQFENGKELYCIPTYNAQGKYLYHIIHPTVYISRYLAQFYTTSPQEL